MNSVVLKGIAQRKLRAFLTAVAIVLGVAMVTGTYVLTDTIDKAFTSIFTSSYSSSDVVIAGRTVVADSITGKPTVPESLLGRVRALPEVKAASGAIIDFSSASDQAKLVGPAGAPVSAEAPTFAIGIDPAQTEFNPLQLSEGRWAHGPDQVVVDAGTAREHHIRVGSRVGVAADGPAHRYVVTGLARFGGVDSLGGATLAVLDVPAARVLLGKTGFDQISVAAAPGVSDSDLVAAIRPVLPAGIDVHTGDQQAATDGASVSEFVTFIRWFLLAFAAIALFVGAFVILNTLSITIAQRTRELATLRTLGASRRQVMRSVVLEALVVGVAASIAGIAAGIGLARGLSSLFEALNLDVPQSGTVIEPRTVIVGLAVGTIVTLVASVVPAMRATRISPIAAVREGAVPQRRRSARSTLVSASVAIVSAMTVSYGVLADGIGTGTRFLAMGVGILGLFVGVAMVAPRLVRPIAAVVGWPARRLAGASGGLAARNAVRNPARTASTAAALMIGLALVTFVALLGASLKAADRDAITAQVDADYALTSANGFDPLPTGAGRAIAAAPGVVASSSVRSDRAKAAGSEVGVSGVDPDTITRVYRFTMSAGPSTAVSTLSGREAVVQKGFADDHHITVGREIAVLTPSGSTTRVRVAGVYAPPKLAPMLGEVLITQSAFDAVFPRAKDALTLVDVAPGSGSAVAAGLERSVAGYPDARVRTSDAYVDLLVSDLDTILNLLYVLLALSVIVSLFGMVNTLVLAVFERTRELGMLRAVGMTRRQTRRMVRHESVITALIGAALGLPIGIGLAAVVTHALGDYGVGFALPVSSLVWFTVIAIGAGVVAAIMPARRAARLRPLEALSYE